MSEYVVNDVRDDDVKETGTLTWSFSIFGAAFLSSVKRNNLL